MNIQGIGVDLCQVSRMRRMLEKWGDRLLGRVFHEIEWNNANGQVDSLAARWAVKEAFVKAIGTGFREIRWNDVFVSKDDFAKPQISLQGSAQNAFDKKGGGRLHLSFSHENEYAVAFVIWEK